MLSDGDTGRKSGIWQGSTEVELKQLERQWDDYKVTTCNLSMPSMARIYSCRWECCLQARVSVSWIVVVYPT